PVKYEKDASREKGQDNITVPGKDGSKTTTTTYTVNQNNGEAIAHVGEPIIVNPTTTIVKVAAKDTVVTSKDGNNIVKTATSYTVNPDNGNIIEHTTKETFKENGLKDKVEVETIPSPVKYEK
ncbi:G5 domain-containing protein, partial [Streptococcus mitis]